jgi:hypothetical protein
LKSGVSEKHEERTREEQSQGLSRTAFTRHAHLACHIDVSVFTDSALRAELFQVHFDFAISVFDLPGGTTENALEEGNAEVVQERSYQ